MDWRRRRSGLDLLLSPAFAIPLVVLWFNDRAGKQRWPGIVTGKLSDVAGVAMVAVLLTALTRRRSASPSSPPLRRAVRPVASHQPGRWPPPAAPPRAR